MGRGTAALAVVALALLPGCRGGGGGGTGAARARATTSVPGGGTATTLLTDLTPAAEAGSATAAGAGDGPTTTVDAGPARAVWERWARALASGDLAGASDSSRDGANGWTAVIRVVAQSDAAAGHPHSYSGRLSGGTLRAGSAARVGLNAELAFTEGSDQFSRTVQITEPVLDRIDGGWTLIG